MRGPFLGLRIGGQTGILSVLSEAIKVASGLNINFPIVGDWRAEAAAIEGYVSQDIRFVTGFDDVKSARGASFAALCLARGIIKHRHIQFSVCKERAGITFLDA